MEDSGSEVGEVDPFGPGSRVTAKVSASPSWPENS